MNCRFCGFGPFPDCPDSNLPPPLDGLCEVFGGRAGCADGVGARAAFRYPKGLAIGPDGLL